MREASGTVLFWLFESPKNFGLLQQIDSLIVQTTSISWEMITSKFLSDPLVELQAILESHASVIVLRLAPVHPS